MRVASSIGLVCRIDALSTSFSRLFGNRLLASWRRTPSSPGNKSIGAEGCRGLEFGNSDDTIESALLAGAVLAYWLATRDRKLRVSSGIFSMPCFCMLPGPQFQAARARFKLLPLWSSKLVRYFLAPLRACFSSNGSV